MINIKYYQHTFVIKKHLTEGKITKEEAYQYFNSYRPTKPVVFNIETTNNCNMRCKMCPRTTQMTRDIGTMDLPTFTKIIEQLKPWSSSEWEDWTEFVRKNYKVEPDDMSENHFFLYVIPKVINLHGFGEPLLDKHIFFRVEHMNEHNIQSYFSSNPYNITLEKGLKLMKAGLNYLKLSGDNIKLFEKSENIIKQLLKTKETYDCDTTFILDVVDNPKDYVKLQKMFKDYDVYMYHKSKDNQWYDPAHKKQQSIHWLEPCQFPWSSLSIMWDGSVVPCTQDYNNELVLGNVNNKSLINIWNSDEYKHFKENMLTKSFKNKCVSQCDMKLVGDFK